MNQPTFIYNNIYNIYIYILKYWLNAHSCGVSPPFLHGLQWSGLSRLLRSIRFARALRSIRIVRLFRYIGALRTLALSILSTMVPRGWTIKKQKIGSVYISSYIYNIYYIINIYIIYIYTSFTFIYTYGCLHTWVMNHHWFTVDKMVALCHGTGARVCKRVSIIGIIMNDHSH